MTIQTRRDVMQVLSFNGPPTDRVQLLERPVPVPDGRQVLVRARYAALNPADLMQLDGGYSSPPGAPADVAGVEVCGTVQACGDAVTALSAGDRVFGLVGGGGLADHVIADADLLTSVPPALDDLAAAAVPESYITAHDALFTQGGLRSGERVLIHGGTGGVGTAAIGLARLAGAEVYATVRHAAGRDLVRKLGATPLAAGDFAAEFRSRAPGGADVVVDLVGAPNYPSNLAVLAAKARLVAVGLGGGSQVSFSLNDLMRARASIIGTVLRARPFTEKAAAVTAFAHEVVPHLAAGRLHPLIDEVVAIHRHADAFARMASAGKRGKVLLDFDPGPVDVPVRSGPASEQTLENEEESTCLT